MTTKPESYMTGSLRLTWLVVLVVCAAAIGFSVDLAWERFSGVKFVFAGMLLAATAVAEVLFWHKATIFWLDRRLIPAVFAACVAVVCSAGTLYTNYSTSAIGQDHKASEKLTSFNKSDDLDRSQKELSDKVSRLEKQLSAAPTRTAAAAQAAIDNAMAHKFWGLTDGCKATKGQQTRDFCAQYAAAVADKANDGAAVQARAELANAQKELKDVRDQRGSTEAVASKENPALGLWAFAGFDDRQAKVADSMVMMFVGQVLMMIGGILLGLEHAADKEPKSWLPAWLSNWVKGRAYVAATGRQMQTPAEIYAQAAAAPESPHGSVFLGIDVKTPFAAKREEKEKEEEEKSRLLQIAGRNQEAS